MLQFCRLVIIFNYTEIHFVFEVRGQKNINNEIYRIILVYLDKLYYI